MPAPRLSIRTTVLFALVLAVLVPAAALWAMEQRLAREVQQPLVTQFRQALVVLAAEALAEPLWTVDQTQTRAALERLVQEPSVRSVRLTERRPGAPPVVVVRPGAQPREPAQQLQPESERPLTRQVLYEGQLLGELEVTFEASPLDRALLARRNAALVLTVLQIVAAALLLMGVLYWRLVRPIERLKQQASLLGQPGAGPPVPWRSDDELGQLGQHLNEAQAQISELVARLEGQKTELQNMALHDALTGLPNRTLLNELLLRAMATARRDDQRLALLFIDVDHFKAINDAWGHAMGDRLLIELAQRLRGQLRGGDVLGRHSGDEFIALLREPRTWEEVATTADRLLRVAEEPVKLDGRELQVSVSVGIALYPDDATDPQQLMRQADTAMYEAKRLGRARCSFYRHELNAHLQATLQIEQELKRALADDEFVLHYQPLVDAGTGAVVGCEALLRWQHPQRGLVPPLQFIPAAEQCGLISQLGHWTVRSACAQIARWKARGLAFGTVAVNVSALEFRQHRLVDTFTRAMADFHVQPHELEIELTESVLMTDTDTSRRIIEQLGELGLRLAVDDFGTGYSSLAYLKRLRPSKIKIDRGFVRDLPDDEDDRALARAIVQMARALDITVVAEGVETPAQQAFLHDIGCNLLQGYLISRPQPVDAFERLVLERARTPATPGDH